MNYLSFGVSIIFFFLIVGCNNKTIKSSERGFEQRLELLDVYEPHTLLQWGISFEEAISFVYENEYGVYEENKEEGVISFFFNESLTVLWFTENKLSKSIRTFRFQKNDAPTDIFYLLYNLIQSRYQKVSTTADDNIQRAIWDDAPKKIVLERHENGVSLGFFVHNLSNL